jgi:subtilisin family serine protease
MARGRVALVVLVIALVMGLVPVAGGASRQTHTPGSYIVMLEEGTDPVAHAHKKGVTAEHTYRKVFRGYSAALSYQQRRSLRSDAAVVSVEKSRVFSAAASTVFAALNAKAPPPQEPARGLRRIGGLLSPTAKIDGVDERVNVDVAILDSGIQPDHPDLNVVGGTNCLKQGKATDWRDREGHGTLVGGIVAALDNGFGRVGVAPGARLWAVRLSSQSESPAGNILEDDLICGLEWVVANDIEVANMSLSGPGENINDCESDPAIWDALQTAICAAIANGTTLVAAAGNEGMDASTELPAAYPDVIAVSAFSETDGLPGGLGESAGAFGCEEDIADDTFAFFSNFGPVVDLSAPGVCVGSTYLHSTYAGGIGTSFATPFVSGAAALYLANHPDATPRQVRDVLIRQRERGPIAGDPDGIDEGIVNVSRL